MNTGTFKFFSYRDPNISETFNAFGDSIKWALKSITKEKLDEGILNVISSIDKPSSPASEALSDFNSNKNGFTQNKEKYLEKIFSLLNHKLVSVTKNIYAMPNRSVVSNKNSEDLLHSLGFELNVI